MDRRGGGCCIARYGGDADVAWRVGRIMLRFRPIAPKPAAGGAAAPPPPAAAAEGGGGGGGRGKRKAPGGGGGGGREGGRRGRRPRRAAVEEKEERSSSSSSSAEHTSAAIVTLPLMPESPETKERAEGPAAAPDPPAPPPEGVPAWLLRAAAAAAAEAAARPAEVVVPRPVRPAGSWVTVESVVDTWRDGEAGAAREVVRPDPDDEEAPVFVSDRWDRVTWTNEAYRRMVVGPARSAGSGDDSNEEEGEGEGEGEEEEVRVGLVTKGRVPEWGTCGAFTCRVRVRYACRRKGRGSLAAPCDVWRTDGGCYTWRLDVKAALSLSLSL